MQEIWIATGNQGKLAEYKLLLKEFALDIHHQGELSYYTPPAETGKTFEENARIKAATLKAVKPGVWIIGEDSGLEVEGLNNMPGIHSARYGGAHASDAENRAKLLTMMKIRSPLKRAAQFQAVIVAYSPQGQEFILKGSLKGSIATSEKGKAGFGYDPLFIPEGETQTMAELGLPYKNAKSHRALAIKEFIAKCLTTM